MPINLPNIKIITFLGFLASAIFIWYAVFYFESRQNLRITFFDVGQGDASLVEVPGGTQILTDGGPGRIALSRLGRTLPFWDRSIDLLILTHPHADHLDGLLEIARRYKIGMVIESGVEHSIPEYLEWRELLQEKKIPVVYAHVGQKISSGEAKIDILTPLESFEGVSRKNPHDATVVTRLLYGKNSFLFMGDAEKPIEYQLTRSTTKLDSDVLKVGHHGSKTSSSPEFLDRVSPEIAVIQVGRKNRYGHPYQEILDRLTARGATILRNDLDGNIIIESNGDGIKIVSLDGRGVFY